jgi:hypothetical protein
LFCNGVVLFEDGGALGPISSHLDLSSGAVVGASTSS